MFLHSSYSMLLAILITIIAAQALPTEKVARLIANTRMSRAYLAESNTDASDRVFNALEPLKMPSKLKADISTAAEVPRALHSITKKMMLKVFKARKDKHYQVALNEFITGCIDIVQSLTATVNPLMEKRVVRVVKNYADALTSTVKAVLREDQSAKGRVYRIVKRADEFIRGVTKIANEVVEKLRSEINSLHLTDDEALLILKSFAILVGLDAEYADHIVIANDAAFIKVLTTGRSGNPKVVKSFIQTELANNMSEMEIFLFDLFVGITNHYYQRLSELFESLPIGMLEERHLLGADCTEFSKRLKPGLEKVKKLTQATKWWTQSPQSDQLHALEVAADEYLNLRRAKNRSLLRYTILFHSLIAMA